MGNHSVDALSYSRVFPPSMQDPIIHSPPYKSVAGTARYFSTLQSFFFRVLAELFCLPISPHTIPALQRYSSPPPSQLKDPSTYHCVILSNVISLLKQIPSDFSVLQCLEIPFCLPISSRIYQSPKRIVHRLLLSSAIHRHTSQVFTLLQMIDPFLKITLAQLLPYQPSHHALHPLFPDDCVLGSLEPWRVVEVYAREAGRDFGLFGEEHGGFWGRHAAAFISADEVRWCWEWWAWSCERWYW